MDSIPTSISFYHCTINEAKYKCAFHVSFYCISLNLLWLNIRTMKFSFYSNLFILGFFLGRWIYEIWQQRNRPRACLNMAFCYWALPCERIPTYLQFRLFHELTVRASILVGYHPSNLFFFTEFELRNIIFIRNRGRELVFWFGITVWF